MMLFYFIYVYIAPGQEETNIGDIFFFFFFLMEAERSYHFDHWLHVSKISLPPDFTHFFHDFIHVYSLDRDRQPIWLKI